MHHACHGQGRLVKLDAIEYGVGQLQEAVDLGGDEPLPACSCTMFSSLA